MRTHGGTFLGVSFMAFAPFMTLLMVGGCRGSVEDSTPWRPNGALRCEVPGAAENPIRRLTPDQYRASLGAIFPGMDLPQVEIVGNSLDNAYANDVRGQGVSALLVEQLSESAGEVSAAVIANRAWMSCDLASEGVTCARLLAEQVGERAYRRPLSAEERATFEAFLDAQTPDFGLDGALTMLIEGVLQAPAFLYLPEIGDPTLEAPPGMVALSGVEMANRLSFVLWNEPPDETLMAAAAAGELSTEEGLSAAVDRMLEDPRTITAMNGFFHEWMRLDRLLTADVDRELFPELVEPGVREDLEASTLAFVRYAFWEERSMDALFTGSRGYVNDRIAPLFGVPPPGSDELVPVELPPSERAGLITQPGLLTSTSHGLRHSPILRGVLMLDRVLCAAPPPPPGDVMTDLTEEPGGDPVTTRQKIEETHGTGDCSTCHIAIDGMGFTFENYDAIGRYRTTEYDQPVDSTGEFRDRPVANAVELAQQFVTDRGVNRCITTHFYRYAMARTERNADQCQIRVLADDLENDGDLPGMYRRLLLSNAFRFRPEETAE